jgi:hypothetical protein
VPRVANTGLGRAFLGRRVGGVNFYCTALVGPGSPRYLEVKLARTHRVNLEEFVNEGIIPSQGRLDASSVETRSVEARDGDFLMFGAESTWAGFEGPQAV